MSTQHIIHHVIEPGLAGDGFTAPEAAVVRSDINAAMVDAADARNFAEIADNLYYNVMSPAKGPVAAGDGVTDDHAAIQYRLDNLPAAPNSARGGKVVLEPGRTYMISDTLNITMVNTDIDGIVGGTLTVMGSTTIKATSDFPTDKPLIRISIPSGSKGAWIRNLRLDGSGRASVGVEYGEGTISVAHLFDIAIANCTIGIKTNRNCQSILWERVLAFMGITVGVDIGPDMRHVVARDCRFGGTQRGLIVGADNNVGADRVQTAIFDGCEIYTAGSAASQAVLLRNCENPRFINCYIELDANQATTLSHIMQVGTSNAPVRSPMITGNRFGGNAKANYAVAIVNASYPYIAYNGNDINVLQGYVLDLNVQSSQRSRGFVMGGGLGDSIMSTLTSVLPAGYDALAAFVEGDSYPRVHIRASEMLIRFGSGSGPSDAILQRGAPNELATGTGDSFRVDGSWDGGKLVMGSYRLWVDSGGRLRIKNGVPTSDTDGTVVGGQS